jgi:Flp pilus assembly protein TadD
VTTRTIALALGVFVITLAAFSPSLRNGFVDWDETGLIVENPNIRRLGWDQIRWMFTSFHMGPYQPLPWLSLALDYHVWGLKPFGYHLSNLIWHTANAIVFFAVARRILLLAVPVSADRLILLDLAAAVSAIVFAVHPLRVESVAWAAQRRDVMSGFFVLATVWAYLHAACDRLPRSRYSGWIVCSQFMFFMSLLCKATGVFLPAVLSILDVYPLGRVAWSGKSTVGRNARRVWIEKIPFWIMSVAGGIAAMVGQRATGAMSSVDVYGSIDRLALASFSSFFYVRKMLLPAGLSPMYEIPTNFSPWQLRFIVSAIAALGITAIALRWAWRRPAVLAVWLSYLLLLAPVSGVLQTGGQLAADRYSYLPCLGFALLVGGAALQIVRHRTESWSAQGMAALGLILSVVLGSMTWRQTTNWRDATTLWKYAMTVDPESSTACNNAAKTPIRENRLVDAARLLQKSLRLRRTNADAHTNLGVVFRRMGQPYQAVEHYREAERLRPRSAEIQYNFALLLAEEPLLEQLGFASLDEQRQAALERYRASLAISPRELKTLNDLGILHKKMGQVETAIGYYRDALKIDPHYLNARFNLAIAQTELGLRDDAEREYRRVLEMQPGHAGACANLAQLYERSGRYRESAELLRNGLASSPDQPVLLLRLCWLLATAPDSSARNGPEALLLGVRLYDVAGESNPEVLDALAAAYAEVRRFDAAVQTAVQAAKLASEQGRSDLAAAIEARAELYKSAQPFRAPRPGNQ